MVIVMWDAGSEVKALSAGASGLERELLLCERLMVVEVILVFKIGATRRSQLPVGR